MDIDGTLFLASGRIAWLEKCTQAGRSREPVRPTFRTDLSIYQFTSPGPPPASSRAGGTCVAMGGEIATSVGLDPKEAATDKHFQTIPRRSIHTLPVHAQGFRADNGRCCHFYALIGRRGTQAPPDAPKVGDAGIEYDLPRLSEGAPFPTMPYCSRHGSRG